MRVSRIMLGFALAVGVFPTALWASSLRMDNYSRVLVENLQPGTTYSMVKLVNLPLKLSNGADEPVLIALEVIKPEEKRLLAGYEVIPDTSWVSVGNTIAAIAANGVYESDVTIAIPDRKELLGKKYQVDIRARILPRGSFVSVSMAIQGHLLFTIAPFKQDAGDEEKHGNLAYSMTPERVDLKDVPLGKKVEVLTEEGKPVMLLNGGDQKTVFTLFSLDPTKASVKLEPGTVAIPNPDFLTFENEEIIIRPNKAKPIRMHVEFPDRPEYRGKRYQVTISVRSGESGDVTRYMRVMISTAK